ncbi:DUF1294 domain-containing protein [Pseudoxanthomonas daejeonensis]|uniref:DNA-binding protein n=1 Tax=Pseudoxanthomonas daejeonensis TaxID=266062 RepID=A0ABQ6Z5Q3_9GAMM|nr:DUF1294 domain-containing protein [Pseudoxanthomonas daejeonensis]KAF1693801.1 DNA-binding protein [Pseudoxanthomonas daejeonensis]UNK56864.1 DUF1294 domain-containing protein [Pseudoxanthomonas daejeonensis]
MEILGKVVDWNEERGYGFVQPLDAGQPRAFFHVRDYRQDGRRPETGELVKFIAQRQADGRWRASSVRRAVAPKSPPPARAPSPARAWPGWLLLAAHLAGLAWAVHAQRLPALAAMLLFGLCCVTWIAYALDKHAAQRGRRRTPEATLHLLELAGGWPGALLAQRALRHKTRKHSYRVAFWWMVLLNLMLTWAWILDWPQPWATMLSPLH